MEEKKVLRKQMNSLLHSLPADVCAAGSSVICRSLWQSEKYKTAKRIMVFLHMAGEVSLDAFIDRAVKDGKEIYVPRCLDEGRMEGVRLYSLDAAVSGRYGIRTAAGGAPVCDRRQLDWLIVSGLAFDRQGHRLGRGAGFYDRFAENLHGDIVWAVAHGFQLIDSVPVEAHDVSVSVIVTEKEYISTI